MLTPTPYTTEEIELVYNQLVGAYREGEKYILERLLAADLSAWERARANQQLGLIQAALQELGQVTQDWEGIHLPRLYAAGIAGVDRALEAAPVQAPAAEFAALHTASIELVAENLSLGLEGARQLVGRRITDVFRRAGLAALQQGTALGETRRQASKRMIKQLADKGVTAFVDARGAEWNLSTYAEMHIRTSSMEATNLATYNRLAEYDLDLVKVPRHDGECPKCKDALDSLGTIFSISGTSEQYPAEDEARAMGLYHPECLHRPQPYVPGWSDIGEAA